MSDNLLTPADLAALLGVTEEKAMRWRLHYGWPHVRIGRSFRFTPLQVEQILARHTATGVKADDSGRTSRSKARQA